MVPINVGYFIHRMGDWTMLMLGESIFSLIIVDVPNETPAFGVTFYCGVLTVVMLMYLHYESEPHDADSHAMRRSKDAGVVWNMVMHIYSFALVSLGAAFTFFLTHFDDDENHRRLAGGDDYGLDNESFGQKSADLFCKSLAVIFACLDGMTALHIGYAAALKRLATTEKMNSIVVVLRTAAIPLTVTVSQWETDPSRLSYIGLLIVVVQVVLRKVGNICSSHDEVRSPEEAEHEPEHATTPRDLRQSVLMASAWLNMTQEELEALGDDGVSKDRGQTL
eukprot:scaffold9519_cov183-Amphora_coffeaeformis.AAC.2